MLTQEKLDRIGARVKTSLRKLFIRPARQTSVFASTEQNAAFTPL
jgi:hypothetical protein